MNNRVSSSEESRDSWLESVDHDKKQLLGSLAISGMGLLLAGVGIARIITGGEPAEGGFEVAVGSGLAFMGGRLARNEFRMLLGAHAVAAQRQLELDSLDQNEVAD